MLLRHYEGLANRLRGDYLSVLIKNGTIIDGDRTPMYKGHIYIQENKIIKMMDASSTSKHELNILELRAKEVIDATGLMVSPGFIDTHSHSDLMVLVEPELLPKLKQGITTEVLGQDGISMAPLPIEYIEPWRKNLSGLNGDSDVIDWTYETCDGYFDAIEKAGPSINETYLLPHGNIRMEAMGLATGRATQEAIDEMCKITRREMEAGCIGVSSGLIYMPCAYSETNEIVEICKIVKEYDGVFVVHQRSEADDILTSMEEIIHIGISSGVDIHFSHFKVCGKKNWDKLDDVLRLLDEGKEKGVNISFDQYPYPAGSTMLGVILPPWAHDGGTDMLVKRLSDPVERQKMIQSIKEGIPGWDNFIDFVGESNIYITSVKSKANKDVVKLNLEELGKKRNKTPLEATFDLLAEEENAVGMVDFYGTEDHISRIMQREEMNACTDGLLSGEPHPRVFGAFPRILGKYVREEQLMSLEEAIYKMTYKAAKALHIKERGLLKEGYYADITLFDHEKVIDMGTYVEPIQDPKGIEYVLVNGDILISSGDYTGLRSGQVIRHN